MEKMLDGYLAFVSGEGGETNTFVDMNEMILSILNKFRNSKTMIRYTTNDQVSAIQGREQALKRAVTNIISNAFYYGKTVSVGLESNNSKMEIRVDDDGPGIPEDKREEVFKAFYRIEGSRNKETGGVGLGLSIARDIIVSHGGTIELGQSDMGGLRVLISIPL
jgi:two-component system osmolarity sensor histidine kinase EnvZ